MRVFQSQHKGYMHVQKFLCVFQPLLCDCSPDSLGHGGVRTEADGFKESCVLM